LHQTIIMIEIITEEMKYSLWYQHKKSKFCHSVCAGPSCSFVCVFFFSPYAVVSTWERDVQAELTNQMVYQRHVGGFHVFPVCGVWFNRLIPAYFLLEYSIHREEISTCFAMIVRQIIILKLSRAP
jgi:hypothetical protein